MHELLIHQAFASNTEAGGTRHYELASHLAQQGDRFTVIASRVSYLTGKTSEAQVEERDGIEIRRCWTFAPRRHNFVTRVLSFLSFMLSSFLAALETRQVDLVWGTSPPIFQALTAYAAARIKRVPLIFEVRDLWPDFAIETGVLRNPVLIRGSRWLEHFLYQHADCLIVNSPGFLPHLRQCGVPDHKVELLPNGVEVAMFDPGDRGAQVREEFDLQGKFVVLYTGAHGLANDLGTVLRAAKCLEDHPSIVFVLVGDGKERTNLIRTAEEMRLSNVRFIPAQPKERMPSFIAAADVCVAILQPIPMFTTTYPNKVFDYMAAARPTVLAIDGVIREVIEAAQGGVFVPPGDPEALARTILAYYRDPAACLRDGSRARAYVAAHFDRPAQAVKLKQIFERYGQKRTLLQPSA